GPPRSPSPRPKGWGGGTSFRAGPKPKRRSSPHSKRSWSAAIHRRFVFIPPKPTPTTPSGGLTPHSKNRHGRKCSLTTASCSALERLHLPGKGGLAKRPSNPSAAVGWVKIASRSVV